MRRKLVVRAIVFLALALCIREIPIARAQGAKQRIGEAPIADSDADHRDERNAWFFRGRLVSGKPSAELRRRAYQSKMRARAQRSTAVPLPQAVVPSGPWIPLGPMPLASDASGTGLQDYRQVAGRATAIAIDPADTTGNTIYIGGAQSGIWKSTSAANANANSVEWTPLTDNQATLSIGAIAIQPGNNDPAKTVILAATGEADNSGDSYFGLGILRSADAGNTWTLASTANNGALSFSGLGGTRMTFGAGNTAVAAMATTSEGMIAGAVTANTTRGLYTSPDAGLNWTYNTLVDPGGATDATSATSVVYNAIAGKFFAAVRYHGFYSSPDGVTWTRVVNQPGGSFLNLIACPPQSTSNNRACPIYRAELAVVPGRNEMYAWYVYFSSSGNIADGGIWKSLDGGGTWSSISSAGITNCGDFTGCGVEQGSYNLELLAAPNGSATDLYAGAINLYKCSITTQNQTCTATPFLNLTHVYGCNPIGAPAHVHPDQHALAFMIPTTGASSGNALMYFANDGGLYRALNGFTGLNSGSCSGTNLFDDLNQNLGSMTQFVSFSQHPTDSATLLGGTQDNGSPATNQATIGLAWGNVLGGDGGYNAIDPNTPTNFYASNPDIPPSGLAVQLCPQGVSCDNSAFSSVVTSFSLDGDDGAFYFPYILDPQSFSAMLIGTCRVWRGSRSGGAFTALSTNFDSLVAGTCSGNEVNQVRALAVGGPTDSNGSQVIYATTSGFGPLDGLLYSPPGGHVWVTSNGTAGSTAFADVTDNGPAGNINPNQFPISSVAVDSSDHSGATAYVTIMGFTGGAGHIWKTTNFGAGWTDFTANLPDSPVNAVIIDSQAPVLYVGTDIGVFASSTTSANWIEVGPSTGAPGFLPNVAVTALGLFNSGGEKLLRASTYGRGVWQFTLIARPDYRLAITNSPQSTFSGQTVTFNGTASALAGYASSISLGCVAGATAPPSTCTVAPAVLTPASNTPFTVTASAADGDYIFNVQGIGTDTQHTTHLTSMTLHVASIALTTPSPTSITVQHGATSAPVNFQVTAAGSFNGAVDVSCTLSISNAACNLAPANPVHPTPGNPVNMSATVSVPATATAGSYSATLQATTGSVTVTTSFTLNVTSNPDFALSEPSAFPEVNVGSTGTTGPLSITAQDGFSGTVSLSCANTYGAGSCSFSPTTVSSYPATATLTINGTSFTAGSYALVVSGTLGSTTHSLSVPFNVGDYSITGTQALSLAPGAQGTATLTLASTHSYAGKINATCDASALSGAQCSLSPSNPITVASGGTVSVTALINVPKDAATGTYNIAISTHDTSGAPSHSFTVSVSIGQDFLLTSATASQTVQAGQTSGAYNLTVQPVGSSFDAAVTLGCSGLPGYSQCRFNPSTPVTPGNSAVNVVMTISTTAPSALSQRENGKHIFYAAWFMLPMIGTVIGLGGASRRRRRSCMQLGIPGGMVLLALTLLAACSGVSAGGGGGGGGHPGTPPGTYKVSVTGTSSGALPDAGQSTQVTLVVN